MHSSKLLQTLKSAQQIPKVSKERMELSTLKCQSFFYDEAKYFNDN